MQHEGYRYVRSYGADFSRDPRKDKSQPAWQLWEIRNGRSCRVGTAMAEYQYRQFLDPMFDPFADAKPCWQHSEEELMELIMCAVKLGR